MSTQSQDDVRKEFCPNRWRRAMHMRRYIISLCKDVCEVPATVGNVCKMLNLETQRCLDIWLAFFSVTQASDPVAGWRFLSDHCRALSKTASTDRCRSPD
ncbi:hypothetical protein NPIL_654781 [Nephila pilipes]|uniref:Uncharacterized protein n=1 Tax=Nephila pilipes TaxID=299642 RepID=A0A8X6T6A5_NEPPI|nr:hypothetical protein NPIL_654781 [Nephila pilipes]